MAASHSHLPKLLQRKPHQSQWLAPSREELWLLLNSAVSMIEVIFQFALSTDPRTGSNGKLTSCLLTIITIYLSSLKVSVRSKTHTDSSPCKESLICSRKAVLRYFQLFHNSSSLSRVSYNFLHIELKRFVLNLKRLTYFFSCTQHS